MNQNYAVIGCIPQFCIDLKEFTEKKNNVNTNGYDMELGSKNLSIAIGFIGKTTNALSLKCMMEFDDIVSCIHLFKFAKRDHHPIHPHHLG